jgi:uracil-DNA glycosylase
MSSAPLLHSLIRDVCQRVEWELELNNSGYSQPSVLPQTSSMAESGPKKNSPHSANENVTATAGIAAAPPVSGMVPAHGQPKNISPTAVPPTASVAPSQNETTNSDSRSRAHALAELKFRLDSCTECALSGSRSRIVFSDGTMNASIAFVGDAPSREEDTISLPFIGERGHLLNKIIIAIGERRENSYLCNAVKCAPKPDTVPTSDEIRACSKYLFEQLEKVSPKIIVALGQAPASVLLNTDTDLARLRGQFRLWRNIPVMATWSLDTMLKDPATKRDVWADMKQVKGLLQKS